ncbi:cupin domain-containing protein [Mesorhizobium sp. 1M-11]|uniref:cupin domain-containing protein n=1 Tax=Mesorhizobium sp. 1M-11 TaxID=1529006 RepID=UPI0006C73E56|nr:cupin domain-containing protein [Mesorhizobium sp. 1M-11]
MQELSGPDVMEWLGVRYRVILPVSETAGAVSIVDSLSPAGSGPPRHVHEREDETFILMSGACEFWLEGQSFTKKAGETAFMSRGREHTFRVLGDEPCRHFVILSPGGFEAFFADMAKGRFRIPQDMDQIAASAARRGLRFTGPPLGG